MSLSIILLIFKPTIENVKDILISQKQIVRQIWLTNHTCWPFTENAAQIYLHGNCLSTPGVFLFLKFYCSWPLNWSASTYMWIFFNSTQFSTIQSVTGWIGAHRIVDMEEPHMWLYADLYVQILTVWRVSTPNLLVFQG